jgi:hypothetical protein
VNRIIGSVQGKSDRGVFASGDDVPSTQGSTLCCTAVFVDEVDQVGPQIGGDPCDKNRMTDFDPSLLWIFDCAAKEAESSGSSLALLHAMASEIFYKAESLEPCVLLQLLLADVEYACERWRNMSRAICLERLGLEFTPLSFTVSADTSPETRRYLHWAEIFTKNLKDDTAAGAALLDEQLRKFLLAKRAVSKLCMAFTSSGRIGILPPLVKAGDLICVLKGFSLPVVLRKGSEDGYMYVGPCHIHSLMNGEAGDLLRNGKAGLKDIRIH